MKNLKKVLALVVVFAMMMSTVAFAGYPDVDATADYADSVALLSALEILEGDEQGKFNPESTITRAEFAAVVCRALGLENSANSAMGATIFNDVAANHWATGYINLATQQGIVNGKGNGIFDPEGNVTYAEAVKMLVVALGYEPVAAAKGGYPTGYLAVANSIKMTAGIYGTGTNVPALRKTVAMLTANAMETPVMDQTYGTEIFWTAQDSFGNYKTLLTDMDVYVATGVVGAIDKKEGTYDFVFTEPSDDFEFGYDKTGEIDNDYTGLKFDVADSNIADMFLVHSKVYVEKIAKDEYNALIALSSDMSDSLEINSSDLDVLKATVSKSAKSTVEYYESAEATKATKIEVAENPIVIVNGIYTPNVVDLSQFAKVDASIEFVENLNNDKYFDAILVTVYESAIVESVYADEAEYSQIKFANNAKLELDLVDPDLDIEFFDKDENKIELKDIAEGDVLSMVVREVADATASTLSIPAAKDFKEKISIINLGKNTVEGVIDGFDDDYAYINGTEYEVSKTFADNNRGEIVGANGIINGAEGIFYLSSTGKIIGFEGTAPVNYGYILDVYADKTSDTAYKWEVSMLTKDGVDTYGVYTTVDVDGNKYTKTNRVVAGAGTYEGYANFSAAFKAGADFTDAQADLGKKAVEYKLTSDGKIKFIERLDVSEKIDNEYNADTNRLGGKRLDTDAVVFDITNKDVDDAKALDYTALVDDGEYKGIVAGKKGAVYNVFLMTTGNAVFTSATTTLIAASTMETTLNGEDAYAVTYYANGSKTAQTAYFVDKSKAKYSSDSDYTTITKGSVFYASVNAEGVVGDFAILAVMDETTANLVVDATVLNALYAADKDVAFVYGSIDSENDGVYTIKGTGYGDAKNYTKDIEVLGGVNEYQYNANAKEARKHYVDVRSFDSNGVGTTDTTKKYYVFAKFVDGELVDIYSSTKTK